MHNSIQFYFLFVLLLISTNLVSQIPVNANNFIQAETHRHFKTKVDNGGFGQLVHNRAVISVEDQYIMRMNRDTRYSSGIFDLTEPVSVKLPKANGRFQSLTVTNENHHIKKTIYTPGEFTFTQEDIGTRYVQITIRIFVNSISKEDNILVTQLQDRIVVRQDAVGSFEIPDWDVVSLDRTRGIVVQLVRDLKSAKNMFGDKGSVNPILHLIGTAAGYGGLPEKDAVYLNVYPEKNDGEIAYILNVPKDVPVDAFWSISVYNNKGYFEENEFDSYSLNNITSQKNADGSTTIHLGGDSNQMNFIPITPGWSYNVRMYRPRKEILDSSWRFPDAQPVVQR